jgi:CRISPR-associated protein Csm1
MRREVALASLYGLLHDIGKPIQRFLRRAASGKEKGKDVEEALRALSELTKMDINTLMAKALEIRHDETTKWVLNAISQRGLEIPQKIESVVEDVVKKSDRLSSSERRLGEPLEFSKKAYDIMKNLISMENKKIEYEPENTPLITPTWILALSGYLETVGLKTNIDKTTEPGGLAGTEETSEKDIVENFKEALKKYASAVKLCLAGSCNEEELKSTIKDLLVEKARIFEDSIWLPVFTISSVNLANLKARKIEDAIELSSYSLVVKEFADKLNIVLDLYNIKEHGARMGLIDTIEELIKYTCLLVPSAIYSTLAPDISLYAHSKLSAAYASSLVSNEGKLRLLVLDVNQIQEFISRARRAGGASRLLRGRSLLVELAQDALASYTLYLFGGMPRSNLLTIEGGSIDIVIPDLPDLDKRVEKLRSISYKLSKHEFNGRLGFTVAYSKAFDVDSVDFINSLVREEGGFRDVLDSLAVNLGIAKVTRIAKEPLYIDAIDIVGFDALTNESVSKEDIEKNGLIVDSGNMNYVSEMAGPDTLRKEEIISGITHLSLVAGSLARNMVAVIGLYFYEEDKDALPSPATDIIESLTNTVTKSLCRENATRRNLLCSIQHGISIGFVPLSNAGALYILVSLKQPDQLNPLSPEYSKSVWSTVSIMLQVLTNIIKESKEIFSKPRNIYARMDIKTINTFVEFIPSRHSEILDDLRQTVEKLLSLGIDVSFSSFSFNSHHPIGKTSSSGEFRLKSLDEYDLIAVGKMDCDKLGDVKRLASYSPSRLVSISELINLTITAKSYLKIFQKQELFEDVIALYAGGDDAVFYGDWIPVILYIISVYKDVRSVLPHLTFSIGITIDKSDLPIILLYEDVVDLLRQAKKVKASAALKLSSPTLIPVKVDGKKLYKLIDLVPLEKPSRHYPWPADITACWNLECLARVLEQIYLYNKGLLTGEAAEQIEKLLMYRRDLYILSMIGAKLAQIVQRAEAEKDHVDLEKIMIEMLPIEIEYAYVWARRYKDLLELNNVFQKINANNDECGIRLLVYPDDIVGSREKLHDALRTLLASKTVLDHILLATRVATTS